MTERLYIDPVLVALSDLLVMTALERACSRSLPRSVRGHELAAHERHVAYLTNPIDPDRIEHALRGAWVLCPYLAARHDLPIDYGQWAGLLDSYVTALLMVCEPHETDTLRPHLAPLGIGEAWARPFMVAQ